MDKYNTHFLILFPLLEGVLEKNYLQIFNMWPNLFKAFVLMVDKFISNSTPILIHAVP
jgi:hypothetical protein